MKLSIVSSLVSLVGLVAAAPAPAPQIPTTGNVIRADTRSQYSVWTGAIAFNTSIGRIFKNGRTTDITTLLTFTYPAASSGRTCRFNLYLDSAATVSGTTTFDLFSSLYPATRSTTTWPPGNGRNVHLARLNAVRGGQATYVSGQPSTAAAYPCPAGQTLGYELVGNGDNTEIQYTASTTVGAYITYA